MIENADGPGPYGAKGMSEGALLPVAPAVAAAVADATGVVIRDLPLSPERVWQALRGARADVRRTYPLGHAFELPREDVLALVGGKAANLGEMLGLGAAGAAGLRRHDRDLPGVPRRRLARRPRRRAAGADGRGRGGGRAAVRRCRGPVAGQRPVGGAGVDARDDGHDPRPGPERRDRARPRGRDRRPGVRRRMPRSVPVDVPLDRRRRRRARRPVGAAPARDLGRLPLVEQRPRPGVSAARVDPRRPGHGRHRPGDGVREPRRRFRDRRRVHPEPGDRRAGAVRRRAVRRPGRGRRRRDPRDGADRGARRAAAVGRGGAAGRRRPARAPLRRPVRHRVHGRAGPAVDAPGPGREAQSGGGAPDRGRHGGGSVVPAVAAGGVGAGRLPAGRPADGHDGAERLPAAARDGPRRVAWGGQRRDRDEPGGGGARGRGGPHRRPRPRRDVARRRPRDVAVGGDSHRPRRAREPRGGRRPRLGHPGGGRRERDRGPRRRGR